MTDEQRARLVAILPAMKIMARRAPTQNEYHRRFLQVEVLESFMRGARSGLGVDAADHWIAIAEKAAEGHDKPGIVRMPSMAAVLSGMPPEHKED